MDISQVPTEKILPILGHDVSQWMAEHLKYTRPGLGYTTEMSKNRACPQGIHNLEKEEDAYAIKALMQGKCANSCKGD